MIKKHIIRHKKEAI